MEYVKNERPIVGSIGVGVDSTAMLIGMRDRGIRPDLLLFADTGAERPSTYIHLVRLNKWCERNGFPQIETVRYVPPIAPYKDLEGNCVKNETLPSIAFGFSKKTCSVKWKVTPQEEYINRWMVEHGHGYFKKHGRYQRYVSLVKRLHAVGLDDSPADRKRRDKAHKNSGGCSGPGRKTYAGGAYSPHCDYWYPLQEWGMDREACKALIAREGMIVPEKSCCFFCPAMKKHEILEQKKNHPELHARALAMEAGYINGKHYRPEGSVKGLGGRFAWKDVKEEALAEAA